MKYISKETRELLTINPHALRGLHCMIGYNFEQPYTIAHIKGRFTVKSALKTIGGADRENVVSLLCLDLARSWRNQLALVTVDSLGNIDIEHKGGYKFKIDYFITKADFNEARKSEGANCFIIAQRAEYVKKPQVKPFDVFARYEYIPGKDRRCYDRNGNVWMDSITVRALDGSNNIHEIQDNGRLKHYTNFAYHTPGERRLQSHGDIIDKSGYILPVRRAELKHRADQLRAERAKSAYLGTDGSAMVETLRTTIKAKRAEFAAAIVAADSETLLKVAHNLYFDFAWAVREFERFAEKTARRDFCSIEASERAYNSIITKLQKEVK